MKMKAADYSATELMRNGAPVEIRASRPADRTEMLAAIGPFSKEALYRRFFAPKRHFSEREIEFYLNVDFSKARLIRRETAIAGLGIPLHAGAQRYDAETGSR